MRCSQLVKSVTALAVLLPLVGCTTTESHPAPAPTFEPKAVSDITDRLAPLGWKCNERLDATQTEQEIASSFHRAFTVCDGGGTVQIWRSASVRTTGAAMITLSEGNCQIEDGVWVVNGNADLVKRAQSVLGGSMRCREPSPTPRTNLSSSSTPQTSPTPSPIPPQVQEWMQKVNANGDHYGAEDATWACDTLNTSGPQAAWDAVGDDRLIWAGRLLCKQHQQASDKAAKGFRQGNFKIGKLGPDTIPAGTYVTAPEAKDCYWERVDKSGHILDNGFVTFAPKGVTVTIRSTDAGFTTRGCGPWIPSN